MRADTANFARLSRRRGVTLVELLTTICVLGLLTSIALPQISSLTQGEANETRHRRNAQSLASVCMTADAAGFSFVVDGDLEQTIRNIIKGGSPSSGPFKGKKFAVRGLVEEDVEGVQKYLTITGDQLAYHREPKVASKAAARRSR